LFAWDWNLPGLSNLSQFHPLCKGHVIQFILREESIFGWGYNVTFQAVFQTNRPDPQLIGLPDIFSHYGVIKDSKKYQENLIKRRFLNKALKVFL